MITQCPKTGRTCEVTCCTGCWQSDQASTTTSQNNPWVKGEDLESFNAWLSLFVEGRIVEAIRDEREAIAKMCDEVLGKNNISDAIRARGSK